MNTEIEHEEILHRIKENLLLFIIRNIWNIIWFIIGTALSIGAGTLIYSGIYGTIFNDGKMNMTVIRFGMILIVLIVIIRILHIILLRKNQFYIISTKGIISEGGFLTRFNQTLCLNEIQSVRYTQTLPQQILGCGNIVISSAAAARAGMVLKNIDHVNDIYNLINDRR